MRPRDDRELVTRWFEADATGRSDEADGLFASLAAGRWSRLDAPRGLAGRIVASLASGMRPVWWDLWWVRVALAAALASVGGALALLPSSALASAGVSALVGGARAMGWLLACSGAAIEAAWALWFTAAQVSSWIGVVLSAPFPQFLVALNLALAAAASVALRRLLRPEEIPS